jgi:hypothetical protein
LDTSPYTIVSRFFDQRTVLQISLTKKSLHHKGISLAPAEDPGAGTAIARGPNQTKKQLGQIDQANVMKSTTLSRSRKELGGAKASETKSSMTFMLLGCVSGYFTGIRFRT